MPVVDDLIGKYRGQPDVHITRVMGAWIVVSAGKVVEIDRTQALHACPLQKMLSDADIEGYVYEKMEKFGHFTASRELLRTEHGVPFGASEMLMYALRKGLLDAAVTVCDGAGTVVTNRPAVVQGIGARMNGLFHTSPIPETQRRLRAEGCILFDDARINQIDGLRAAASAGWRRLGVTVNACRGENLPALRDTERTLGLTVTAAGICSTGVGQGRAEEVAAHTDLWWSCASKLMRDLGRDAVLQITHGIPIFVKTFRGLAFVAAYSDEDGGRLLRNLDLGRQHLLSSSPGGRPVTMGQRTLWLEEAALPVPSRQTPTPLR